MQSIANRVIIASAGSGKTTFLVDEALRLSGKRIALLTYTNDNIEEIKRKLVERNGVIPSRIEVVSWFRFLLHECARPYQKSVYRDKRIRTIHFPKGRSSLYTHHKDTARYYFRNGDEIYADKIAQFVLQCHNCSAGLVIKRLKALYDYVFIDELQDLAGYELDLLEILLKSGIHISMVGDPRQNTYATNQSPRNAQFRGANILKLVTKWESDCLCKVERHAWSHRCNQTICDHADALWPEVERTVSYNIENTGHDGVFVVRTADLDEYVRTYDPVLLRYSKTTDSHGYPAMNFGSSKGKTFNRVLILPHGPIGKYLSTDDAAVVSGSREKFYVALTRARHSVALLHDGNVCARYTKWPPDSNN